jgi:hypothetical protein
MSGWSKEEEEELRKLARSGLSVPEIAKKMRRGAHSIRSCAAKLNIVIARAPSALRMRKFNLARQRRPKMPD